MEMTGYKDANGNDILVGDIMFNPFIGDYWLVAKYTEKEKTEYDSECDYCLLLYGSKDCWVEDLDTPKGFKIICHSDGENYQEILNEMTKLAIEMNQ